MEKGEEPGLILALSAISKTDWGGGMYVQQTTLKFSNLSLTLGIRVQVKEIQ